MNEQALGGSFLIEVMQAVEFNLDIKHTPACHFKYSTGHQMCLQNSPTPLAIHSG